MIGDAGCLERCLQPDEAVVLRDDLDVDLPFVFHGGGFRDGAQGIGDAALFTDDLAEVAGSDAHFISGRLFLRNFGNVHLIRLVHERFNQVLDQVFQRFLLEC